MPNLVTMYHHRAKLVQRLVVLVTIKHHQDKPPAMLQMLAIMFQLPPNPVKSNVLQEHSVMRQVRFHALMPNRDTMCQHQVKRMQHLVMLVTIRHQLAKPPVMLQI